MGRAVCTPDCRSGRPPCMLPSCHSCQPRRAIPPSVADWNPQMDLQAQARAHRMGQTKEVRGRSCWAI